MAYRRYKRKSSLAAKAERAIRTCSKRYRGLISTNEADRLQMKKLGAVKSANRAASYLDKLANKLRRAVTRPEGTDKHAGLYSRMEKFFAAVGVADGVATTGGMDTTS